MDEKIKEEHATLTEEAQHNLIEKGLVFEQLLQSERFTEFFNYNYDLAMDEESRELSLIEVPPEEVMKRTKKAMLELAQSGPRITAPSAADISKLG